METKVLQALESGNRKILNILHKMFCLLRSFMKSFRTTMLSYVRKLIVSHNYILY